MKVQMVWATEFKFIYAIGLAGILLSQMGCATNTKKIAGVMLGGAAIGAVVGHQFVHHGVHKQYETQNTIVTSAVFALVTGGALAWHYREVEGVKVEISGRYSRYRLCDPVELRSELTRQFEIGEASRCTSVQIDKSQIGKSAIALDDNTKWVYPSFRKRYLLPDRGETQVLSERYIWEILKPGSFVTRSQNPNYFYEVEGGQ